MQLTAQTKIDHKVDSLLNLMTLEEKIGQMAQAERGALGNINDIATFGLGSLLSGGGSSPSPNNVNSWADMYDEFQQVALTSNLGIPLIYGVDAVHGHNNVYGAVIFPHNIGLGCTWNPALVKTAGEIVAKEVAATGIDWTFAPCIAVPRNERWGRTYEGFGETAEIQKIMAAASVEGFQGNDLSSPETILACAKHYVGDGGTTNGIDQGNTQLSEEILRDIHMAGYIDAIESGVGSIMASFNSWNGEKLHGHEYLLTTVLKEELGFEGFVVSDWAGVDQINEDYRESIKRAINAGIDMVMVPDRYEVFINHLLSLVDENEVSEDRIDDAVRRILRQKFLLNLFEEPYTNPALASSFGSEEHRDIARQTVRESIVLLNAKNDILPLQKDGQKIMVAGTLANDLGAQCGGWTISWQGSNGNITEGTTILEGIEQVAVNSEVIYSAEGNYNGEVDVAIVVIGEKIPYAEGMGDRSDLSLDQMDIQLVKRIKDKGIPVITLIVSGRPLIINDILVNTDANIAVWYPGTEADGIAEVLFGDFLPSGKLTHSWPRNMDQLPINNGDPDYNPLFEYKLGMQSFPSAQSADALLPYTASTLSGGTQLAFCLSDKITALEYEPDDFILKIDQQIIPNPINTITISDHDESNLILSLTNTIEAGEEIFLSYSGNGIISNNLALTEFTDYYVHNAAGSGTGGYHNIPGKVEAEDYYDMYGIQTEPCTDLGGGLNVGFIEVGDWMKYQLKITQSGFYTITGRISGYEPGSLKMKFNDTKTTHISYTSTEGWQNWENFTTQIYLDEGDYVLEAIAQQNGFNINYFRFELISAIEEQQPSIQQIMVYPNPVKTNMHLKFQNSNSKTVSIKLVDLSGRLNHALFSGTIPKGENSFVFAIDSHLPGGMYFLEIKDESRRYFKKIVVE